MTPRPFKRTAREPGQPLSREEISRGEVRPPAVKPEEKPAKAEPKPEVKPEPKPEPKKEEPILLKDEIKEEPKSKSTTVNLRDQAKKFEKMVYDRLSNDKNQIISVMISIQKSTNETVQVLDGLALREGSSIDDLQRVYDRCNKDMKSSFDTIVGLQKLAGQLAAVAFKTPSELTREMVEKMLQELAATDPQKYKTITELAETNDEIIIDFYNEMKFRYSKTGKSKITDFTKSYQTMLFTLDAKFQAINEKAEKTTEDFKKLLADMSSMFALIDQLEKKKAELVDRKGKNKLTTEEIYNDPDYTELLNRIKNSPFASILPADTLKYPELVPPSKMAFERLASRLVIAAMFRFAAEGGFNTNAISEYNEINAEILSASEDYLTASNAEMSSVLAPAEEKAAEKAPAKAKPSWRERFAPTPEPTTAKKKDNEKKA